MKTLLKSALIVSALASTQVFAGSLSDFNAANIESNLAVGVTQSAAPATSPLSLLGASNESHLSAQAADVAVVTTAFNAATFALEVPAVSKEALL